MGDPSGASDAWRLYVLGSVPTLERGDVRIVPDRRTAALLALVSMEGSLTRERAAALLWPDRHADRARANLRQLLYRLRAEADVLADEPLALRPDVIVDAHADDRARIEIRGPIEPLSGLDLHDLEEVARRATVAGNRVRERLREALSEDARARAAAGDTTTAMESARRLVALDPVDERSARLAMEMQLAGGEAAGALATYARLRSALNADLGVEPSPETSALAERAAAEASSPLSAASVRRDAATWWRPAARRAEVEGWLAEAAELLRAASQGLDPGPELGRILVQLAWLEHQLGRHDAAEAGAEAGLALLPPEDAEGARTEAWFVLGSVARTRGDVERAAERFHRALELADRRAGGRDAGLALRLNLGMVEDALGRIDAALRHYLAALPLAEAQNDAESMTVLWINIGHALLARGDVERARALLLRAADAARGTGDRRLQGYALEGLAACELARGEAAEARTLASRALALARDLGDPGLQVEAAATFADASREAGDGAAARATAKAALELARRHGDRPGTMRAALGLARALGPASPAARRAAVHLARDPHAAPEVARAARHVLATWGIDPAQDGESIDDAGLRSGWDAVVDALVTPS